MIGLPSRHATMELLVFYPETTEPKRRHFDGPVLVGVQQALGDNAEVIPGFTTVPCDGVIQRCVAYCDPEAKQNNRPINTWATTLWHMALQREGYERGLRREDSTIADWLNGNVVVVCAKEPLKPK
jgi:hypothetical protein